MKVVKQIRDIYRRCRPRYEDLKSEVRQVLKGRVEDLDWFYFSRIKSLESFAQKIETGRVADPVDLEDFLACTIVVPRLDEIGKAEEMVCRLYDRKERRPSHDHLTRKTSSDFVFDDLRLYVAMRPRLSGKRPELDGVVFEVQIKTILQHAWSVSTHDMIYKTDTVSWPLERIAFQVKAMLEHAEISISEAAALAGASGVAKRDVRTGDVLEVIRTIRRLWPGDQLPTDIRRLATSILELLRLCKVSVERFPAIVGDEKGRVGGLPRELSPYAFTVQALARSSVANLQGVLGRPGGRRALMVVIHGGMDVPAWMRGGHPRILDLNETVVPI